MIMKRTSILFCSLILLFCAVSAPATAVDTVELIAAAPSAADLPGSDAIVLLEEIGYEVDAGGLMTHRVRTVTKLLTDWSVRNLTDPRIDWDSSRQELIIHTARSFMRDGSEVPTPENGFNEVTADAVRKFASGLSYREMVVSHVGAEIDGVIELDYEIRDLRPGPLPAGGKEELAGPWPILRKTVTVNAVSGASAEIAGAGLLQNPPVVTESAADDHVSVWTVSDVPAFPLDGSNDRRGDLRPALYFSTVGDWRELALRMRILGDQAVVADGGPSVERRRRILARPLAARHRAADCGSGRQPYPDRASGAGLEQASSRHDRGFRRSEGHTVGEGGPGRIPAESSRVIGGDRLLRPRPRLPGRRRHAACVHGCARGRSRR